MLEIESYEQIQQFVQQIRSLRKGFVTNFYWDPNKHPYWIAAQSFFYEQGKECFLMIHQNKSFDNLYYIATDFDAVNSVIRQLSVSQDLVADIVCRGDGTAEQEAFRKMGFSLYRSLYRMQHVGVLAQSDWHKDACVKFGTTADALLVYHALLCDFDPLCEQLPSLKELQDYAERAQLLLIKDGESLCGFLIAEHTGATWYLRYWYTSPDYRNMGIGSKLLKASLVNAIASKRQTFWVIADNENAIKRYEHYGFKKEDMNDYVMIKRICNYERKDY